MKYVATIDVSCFIWDSVDFENQKWQYYNLQDRLATFIEILKKEQPHYLIRTHLIDQMVEGFPFNLLPDEHYEFGNVIYGFLAGIPANNRINIEANNVGVQSTPNITKEHFNDETKEEVAYVLTHLHTNSNEKNHFFTYEYIFGSSDPLKTHYQNNQIVTNTVFFDDDEVLQKFFLQFKRVFDHNPVHHTGKKTGSKKSPLRCYNPRTGDTTIVQDYLERALYENNRYYFFDPIHNVYIVFFHHVENKYHGHEEQDVTKIPLRVREHFHK